MSERETGILDVNPEVVELPTLMQRLRFGLLQVPRFQREFVWEDDDRLKLMQSIVQGIPIGSILTWRTTREVGVFPRIGPHRVQSPKEVRQHHVPTYVLDGHQRLTALFSALVRPPDDANLARWLIYADLTQHPEPGGYRFAFHRSRRELPSLHFPLHMLFDDIDYLRFIRGIKGTDDADTERLIDRATRLVTLFRRYRVPIIPLVTEDFGLVTRTFVLIDQGRRWDDRAADLVNALFQQSDLNADIARLREEILAPLGWGDLHDQWILDACKVAAGVGLGRSDPQGIVDAFVNNPRLFQESGDRLTSVARFLAEECTIPAPRLLPYEQFAAVMTEFFRLCPAPDAARLRLLRRWFWTSVYGIATTSFTFTAIKNALGRVRALATESAPTVEVLDEIDAPPTVIVTRGARARALGLLLWRQRPLRSDETPLDALVEFGEDRSLFAVVTDGERRNDARSQIGNRILANKRDLSALRRKLLDQNHPLSDAFLASHAIPRPALDALRAGDTSTFIRLRTEWITAMELNFLRDEGVYKPPPAAPEAASLVARDDAPNS